MAEALLWSPLALAVLVLLWAAVHRRLRATQGERLLLGERGRVLRQYRDLRDGRVYHPDRNPEIARLVDHNWRA